MAAARDFSITVERSGAVLATRARLADGHWSRFKGLLGRKGLEPGEGLILRPCWSVHMFFMRFPLDVIFIDKEQRVVKAVPNLGVWRMSAARGAADAIEIAAGTLERCPLSPGDRLVIAPVEALASEAPASGCPAGVGPARRAWRRRKD